jgi:hypothetical protein
MGSGRFVPRWSIIAILFVSAIVICSEYYRCCTVPVRQFATQAWLQTESLSDVSSDSKIQRMIKAATRDHYIAPVHGMPRKLIFLRAAAVAPNDIYLIFWPAGVAVTTIRYRGDRDSERLYWKTMVSE